MATSREITSDTNAAFQAAIRSTPSRTNSVSSGSTATSAVRGSDPDTASRTGRYMGHLVFEESNGWNRALHRKAGQEVFDSVWSDQIVGLTLWEKFPTVQTFRQRLCNDLPKGTLCPTPRSARSAPPSQIRRRSGPVPWICT